MRWLVNAPVAELLRGLATVPGNPDSPGLSASLAGTAHQSHSLRDLQSATSRAFPLKPPRLGFSLQSVLKQIRFQIF